MWTATLMRYLLPKQSSQSLYQLQLLQYSISTIATYSFKLVQFREYTSGIVIENREFVAVMWFTLACSTRVINLELNFSIEKHLWENGEVTWFPIFRQTERCVAFYLQEWGNVLSHLQLLQWLKIRESRSSNIWWSYSDNDQRSSSTAKIPTQIPSIISFFLFLHQ